MTEAPLRASVIVVTFNSARYVEGCLAALSRTLPAHCETIVVDNASTDDTTNRIVRSFPDVRLFTNSENTGFAAANNFAASKARGAILAGVNPDVVVSRGWLEALVAPLERSQQKDRIGATTARIVMHRTGERINACGNVVHLTGITTCRGLGSSASHREFLKDADVGAISGACFAIPARVWEGIGGFDDDFFMYLEDTEISLRLRLAGYRCRYTSGAIVYHDYQGTFSAAKQYYLERNRLLMMLGTLSERSLLALVPALICAELLVWIYCISKGASWCGAKARSYAWLWQNRKRIGRKRRCMQFGIDAWGERRVLGQLATRLELGQVLPYGLATLLSMLTIPVFAFSRFLACVAASVASTRAPSDKDEFVVGK